MNEQNKNTLSNNTKVTLGLAIALFLGAAGFLTRIEARITKLETLIEMMEGDYMPRKEVEIQLNNITGSLERIEDKLNIK